ncbi:MAG: LysM peptidoglycan-binding domain-containing protein [Chthoniobacter sp.]|uniref:LysM peptidoglycan-binding domain-containing protein n=1 Tax=Chthoniobacter sp. TaxID=2510640 RepID=UPI0032A78B4A
MSPKLSLLALTAALLVSPALHAATGTNLDQEYQQMRKVALRDPKVKAAYEEADRKLEAKIVQMDPALAHYQPGRSPAPETATPTAKPVTHSKPKPESVVGGFHTTHTVAKGETLGGIASQNGVTVAALKTANHIVDEKKLAVGQVLAIPAKHP